MQSLTLKNIYLYVLFALLPLQGAHAQESESSMAQADTFFVQKKYTEALQYYDSIFTKTGKYSAAMLLKMAFIEEGMGNYTKALFYLNLYYNQRPNEQVIRKMDELAGAHQLSGYQYDDMNFILIYYERYFLYIAFALIAFGAYIFAIIISKKLRREYIPIRHGFGFMVYLAGSFIFLNLSGNDNKAIIHRNNVYLMSAPSAGAKFLGVVQKGHRVKVLDKKDIWIEIEWEKEHAFIREQNVWMVN